MKPYYSEQGREAISAGRAVRRGGFRVNHSDGMQVPHGRFLLVELESNVPARRVAAYMDSWAGMTGVVSVCDLAVVSAETLDSILLKPEPVVAPQRIEYFEQAGLLD